MLFWIREHHGLQDHQLVLGQQEVQRPHHHRLRPALRRRQRKTSLHHGENHFHVVAAGVAAGVVADIVADVAVIVLMLPSLLATICHV